MKKLILHIVLLSYTVVMLKPVLPYVSDFINHILFYKQHMATVHFENGKHHVHKEIVDNTKKDASQKEIPAAKKDNTTTDHISFLQKEPAAALTVNGIIQIPVSTALLHNYLSGDYPPPRA
ncbi:MAG: hypothetical protein JNM14_07980 [Ferruginibacter sp.]|nr:hypothetical protein [Ferruginibacter sp.]